MRLAVDPHRLADDLRICAEVLPEPVSEDHDMCFARLPFFGKKIAAQEKGSAQHSVVAWRGFHAVEELGTVLGGKVEVVRAAEVQFLE